MPLPGRASPTRPGTPLRRSRRRGPGTRQKVSPIAVHRQSVLQKARPGRRTPLAHFAEPLHWPLVRIISGTFRGRRLLAPAGRITRPITDRVKESLFSILAPWLPDANVADLFCGTGSLGLEALSRGGATCRFADRDGDAISRLKRNIDTLDVRGRSTVWSGNILAHLGGWLTDAPEMDIVFLDPPYPMARQWVEDPTMGDQAAASIFAPIGAALAADGVVMLRTPRDLHPPETAAALVMQRRKEYGSMALNFYERSARSE